MKTIFSILTIIILLFTNGFAQNNIKFNKTKYYFGDSLNSSANVKSIAKLDTSYYLGLDAYSDSLLYTSYVVKTDLIGNEIKRSIRFGSDSLAYFIGTGNGLIVDSDSNIVIIGGFIQGEWGGFAIKLNSDLDTIWVKHFLFPDSLIGFACDTPRHKFEAIKQTPDGGYIIAGSYFKDSINTSNNLRAYLLKLDTAGNVEWRKVYQNVKQVFDIAITSDSGFVFSDFISGYAIAKTDKFGNIEWKQKPNLYTHLASGAISITHNNEIISLAPYLYANPDQWTFLYGVNIVKYNLSGTKLWDKKYYLHENFRCPGLHQSFEIECFSNSNIIVAGTSYIQKYDSPDTAGYKGVILKLNSNGDSLWSRYYGYGPFEDKCQFNDLLLTKDGGFLSAGYHKPYNYSYNSGAWFVKMDSLGFAPGSYTVSVNENFLVINKKPLLYPNPANSNINLRFSESSDSQFTLLIYNSSGVLVKQKELSAYEQEYRINIEDLETGVYFISIRTKNKKVFSSKFVKQ